MEIIMHYPSTAESEQTLQKQVAKIHTEAVVNYITKLACPLEQKMKLVQSIEDELRNGQET